MQNWMGGTYSSVATVTPSDTTPVTCRAIWVVATASLTIATKVGGTPILMGATLAQGTLVPIELNEGTINAATTGTVLILA